MAPSSRIQLKLLLYERQRESEVPAAALDLTVGESLDERLASLGVSLLDFNLNAVIVKRATPNQLRQSQITIGELMLVRLVIVKF